MSRQLFSRFLARRALAVALTLSAAALPCAPAFAQASQQQRRRAAKSERLSEEQRIAHVLNRLGFGPRPGDVERVRRMGLENYIEQQLRPEKIDDAAAEARLRELPTLRMTTAELYAKYPQPGQLIRQLQRQGRLPADLAEQYENRNGGNADAATKPDAASKQAGARQAGAMDAGGGAMRMPAQAGEAREGARNDYRQAVQAYYREQGLQLPQRITAELQSSRILRAVYSERQLQESLVDFWTNHFNVFAGKGADRWLLVSYDRDTIRPNALGKFRDLLTATAQSPAMLFYLDNYQSVSPQGNRRAQGAGGAAADERRPRVKRLGGLLAAERIGAGDEERMNAPAARPNARRQQRRRQRQAARRQTAQQETAQQGTAQQGMMSQPQAARQQQRPRRGINENYARELMELHTLGVEGGYTQKDVQEVARCFTGWTIFDPRGIGSVSGLTAPERAGTFFFNPRLHDDGEKIVLGHKIPAGGGINDGLLVLDILSKHPSTAKFVATKLARRFVSDGPPPALVERVAKAFTKSDGDIRETMRALISSPEFNSPEAYRAKIKTPFELAVSAVRATGGETNGGPALHQWIARMGEPLYMYQAPTGYPDTAEHWVNTGALLERINFALALVSNRIQGTRVQLSRLAGDAARGGLAAADKSRLIDQFAAAVLQGELSEKSREALLRQLGEAATAEQPGQAATNAGALARSADAAGASMTRAGANGREAAPSTAETTASSTAEMAAAAGTGADASARPGGGRGGRRAQLAAGAPVGEVARIAALILGSPEFQRQ